MISITLPSIHEHAFSRAVANIEATTRGQYEVLAVTPFPATGKNVTWIQEHVAQGCAYAHAIAAGRAHGEYIVPFADDHEFVDAWDEIAIENFERRDSTVTGLKSSPHVPFALGLRGTHSGHVGTNFGILYLYFPFMRTVDVHRIGWIGQDYQRGFGDSDLSLRVWSYGGRCEWSEQGLIRPTVDDHRKGDEGARTSGVGYTEADLRQFVDRWAPRYGQGWNVDSIDGFNVDLRPEENSEFVDGSTFFWNDPLFMLRVKRMDGSRLADELGENDE